MEALKHRTFFGPEKDNAIYPIALANLVLHGIDDPHIWHGNTLTGEEIYGGLWCILSLPSGTFVNAGAGVKTNLLFFTKGKPTEKIWYYDLSDIKVGKKTPLTLAHFEEFSRLLPERADSQHSWTVSRQDIEARNFDLKAVNPHAKKEEDTRTPEELLDLIEAKGREVAEALAALRKKPSV